MTTESEAPSPTEPTPPTEVEADKAAARDRIAKLASVTPWVVVLPLRPWRNYHGGTIPLAFRRIRGDQVEVVGAICGGLRGAPVVQLPEDCRPPGWIVRPVAVAGVDGTATAIIDTAGWLTISTDRWSGGQKFYDLGFAFPVSEQLAKAVGAAAAITAKRPARTMNVNGVIVEVSS